MNFMDWKWKTPFCVTHLKIVILLRGCSGRSIYCRTPQYDRVIRDTHPVELTKEDGDKTLFEKQTEELKHELNERKRYDV